MPELFRGREPYIQQMYTELESTMAKPFDVWRELPSEVLPWLVEMFNEDLVRFGATINQLRRTSLLATAVPSLRPELTRGVDSSKLIEQFLADRKNEYGIGQADAAYYLATLFPDKRHQLQLSKHGILEVQNELETIEDFDIYTELATKYLFLYPEAKIDQNKIVQVFVQFGSHLRQRMTHHNRVIDFANARLLSPLAYDQYLRDCIQERLPDIRNFLEKATERWHLEKEEVTYKADLLTSLIHTMVILTVPEIRIEDRRIILDYGVADNRQTQALPITRSY